MNKEIDDLIIKFIKIKNQGWIKSIRKGNTGIGMTFEYLLETPQNNFEIPDYNGIEIKTKRSYSESYTILFNCTPEGPHYKEVERLKNKYGYPDHVLKNCKVVNNSIFANKLTSVGTHYYFKLIINREKEKIFLHIIDINGNLI